MKSLFSQENNIKYLSIFYNDKSFKDKIDKLFEPEKFNRLSICTFVSSPKFFFKQTKEFQTIELLLGIEDSDNAQKYIFDPKYTNDFFKSLDKEILNKIISGNISIRFTKPSIMIHSKIYIQYNTKTKESRLMIGSANYSASAFGNNKQFEELIVYDSSYNSKITDYYLQRYEDIKKNTLDFVPKRLKKKLQSEDIKILTLSNEESLDILKDRMNEIQAVAVVPDEIDESIRKTKKIINEAHEDIKKELKSIVATKELIEIITKPQQGKMSFIKPAQFIRQKEQIITKVLQQKKIIKEFKDSRIFLSYSEMNSCLFIKDTDDENEQLFQFSKKSDINTIRKKLELLEKFISAYTKYTVNNEENTQKRIFEAILYSFSSVYIWKFRDVAIKQQGRDEVKSLIPMFMLIAGMAQSGKTHLIRFISQIMGNHGQYYHYMKQAKLSSMSHINPQIISQFFNEENLTPIFVDEIDKDYYSSNNTASSGYKGESFIKNITNAKSGKYPCMIATSNTDFSANSQVMRRMYYIQLNNPFDSDKKEETAEYFTNILNEFGTELYQDFIYRLEEKFSNGIEININDILSPSREIFMDYFKEAGIDMPSYFSQERIDDYYLRGKIMWTDLYNIKYKGFKENKKENIILLDNEYVFGSKMSANKEKRELLQYLPIGVLREEKGIVRLDYNKFFDFIGIKSKNRKSFFNIFG